MYNIIRATIIAAVAFAVFLMVALMRISAPVVQESLESVDTATVVVAGGVGAVGEAVATVIALRIGKQKQNCRRSRIRSWTCTPPSPKFWSLMTSMRTTPRCTV
jgi:hypothetical protein